MGKQQLIPTFCKSCYICIYLNAKAVLKDLHFGSMQKCCECWQKEAFSMTSSPEVSTVQPVRQKLAEIEQVASVLEIWKKKDAENTLHFKGLIVKAFVKSNALHTEQIHTWDVMVCALLVGQLRVLVLECLVCQALLSFYLLCSIVCVCGCLPDCRMRTWGVVVGASASVALHHVIKPASAHVSSSSSLSHCRIIDSATKSPVVPSALTPATVAPVQPRTAYSSASICPTPPSRTSINLC